jgi:hypothetical protein
MKIGAIQLNIQALKDIKEDDFYKLVKGHVEDKLKAWDLFLIEANKLGRKKPLAPIKEVK